MFGWCSGASVLVGGEPVEHRVVDQDGLGVVRAAVHDAVADGAELEAFERAQPAAGLGDGRGQVGTSAGG